MKQTYAQGSTGQLELIGAKYFAIISTIPNSE